MPDLGELNRSVSDETLVALAREGDDDAMAALIARLSPLAKARAAVAGEGVLEPEDLAQEGMIGFLQAVASFDPQRGASFRTYASRCIRHRMISAVRSASGKRRVPPSRMVSLEGEAVDPADIASDPQDVVTSREEDVQIVEMLRERLTELEQQVALLYMEGRSYKDIAQILQISDKSVDNAMQRVRRKLGS